VAVSDFNMGAMENKSLNVFNSRLVIASPATSSDLDFARVEGVVAHEYFHKCDPRAAGAQAGPSGGRRRGRGAGARRGVPGAAGAALSACPRAASEHLRCEPVTCLSVPGAPLHAPKVSVSKATAPIQVVAAKREEHGDSGCLSHGCDVAGAAPAAGRATA